MSSRRSRRGRSVVFFRFAAEPLEPRRLLCGAVGGVVSVAPLEPGQARAVEPQVFTPNQLAAAAELDAIHATELEQALAAAPSPGPARILWTNRSDPDNGFAEVFGANAPAARVVVDAAIDAWERVITDFNWPDNPDDNTFEVYITVDPDETSFGAWAYTGGDDDGVPQDGEFVINGGSGVGWWLDPTPYDNSEFRGRITNAFAMDAQGTSPAAGRLDLFTVVILEMTHLLGIAGDEDFLYEDLNDNTPPFVDTEKDDAAFNVGTLWTYSFGGSGVDVLFTDNNAGDDGSDTGEPIHTAEPNSGNKITSGGTTFYGAQDAGNAVFEYSRRYIPSRQLKRVMDEVYPYTLNNAEAFGTAYADLSADGNLLIRGGQDSGSPYSDTTNSNDIIRITKDGSYLEVRVLIGKPVLGTDSSGVLVSYFDLSKINSINLNAGDGNDTIYVDYLPPDAFGTFSLGEGDDSIIFGGYDFDSRILSNSWVSGGDGDDSITLSDDNDTGDDSYDFTSSHVRKSATGKQAAFDTIERAKLFANDGNNTITLTAYAYLDFALNGQGGDDTFNIGAGYLSSSSNLTLTGSTGSDRINLFDQNETSARTYTIDQVSLSRASINPVGFYTVESVVLNASSEDHTFNSLGVAPATTLYINAGDGNNTLNAAVAGGNVNAIEGDIVFNGQLGDDSLNYNDNGYVGNAFGTVYNLTSNTVARAGQGTVTFSSVKDVTVYTTTQFDFFNLDGVASTVNLTINAGAGMDIFDVGDNDVDFILGNVTLNGQGGDDKLNFNDGLDTGPDTYTVTSDYVAKPSRGTPIRVDYTSIRNIYLNANQETNAIYVYSLGDPPPFPFALPFPTDLSINASGGDDTIHLADGDLDTIIGHVYVNGEGGSDHLILEDQLDTGASTYTFTSSTFSRTPWNGSLSYNTTEPITLDAGPVSSTFNVQSTAYVSPVAINAGDGNDTINVATGNLSSLVGSVTVNGQGGTDAINLDDHLFSTLSNVLTITPTTVSRMLAASVAYGSAESLFLNSSAVSSIIVVNGTAPETPVTLNANDGFDNIQVNETSLTAPVILQPSTGSDNLFVNQDNTGSALVRIDASQSLYNIAIGNGGGALLSPSANILLQTTMLSLASTAFIDLADNDLSVKDDGSTTVALNNYAKTGYNNGAWTGPGLRSSTAASNPAHSTGLAIVPLASAVLVKCTWNGDANGDGTVNALDYFIIDSSFLSQTPGLPIHYHQADFNFDDTVNALDYFMIDSAFLAQSGPLSAPSVAEPVLGTAEGSPRRSIASRFSSIRIRKYSRRTRHRRIANGSA